MLLSVAICGETVWCVVEVQPQPVVRMARSSLYVLAWILWVINLNVRPRSLVQLSARTRTPFRAFQQNGWALRVPILWPAIASEECFAANVGNNPRDSNLMQLL